MANAKPQELSVEIATHLRNFALGGGSHEFVADSKQFVLDECEKLAKVNAIDASLLKANLFALTGENELCEYWLRNAEKIGGRDQAVVTRAWCLALLGKVSEAYKYIDAAIERAHSLSHVGIQMAGYGMFRKADDLLTRTKAEIEPKLKSDIATANAFMQKLEISDQQICAVMDVALGFLKEKGLIWLGTVPDFHFLSPNAGGPMVSLTYALGVPYEDAAKLNSELVDRMIAANLDTLGLLVGLRGTAVNTQRSVAAL